MAGYEVIPILQGGFINRPCKVEDRFVTRNDIERDILLNA